VKPLRPPKRLLHLPDGAAQQAKMEHEQRMQAHSAEMSRHIGIRNDDVTAVYLKLLEHEEPEGAQGDADLLARAVALGSQLAREKTRHYYLKLAELISELRIYDVPDHLLWGAKQAGVELIDESPDEEPKKVAEDA
jgi:hypothetical protein